jgi:DNA-binding NtrC family response regulator
MTLNILVIDDELGRIAYRREEFLARWNLFPEAGPANVSGHPLLFHFITSQHMLDERIENDASLALDFITKHPDIAPQDWGLVLLDMQFDHGPLLRGEPMEADTQFGLTIHALLEQHYPNLPIVHFTALQQSDLRRQDSHYLSKLDGTLDDLRLALVERGRVPLALKRRLLRMPDDTITSSDATIRLYADVYRRARTDTPLLIRGATGTGKEHLARYFHLVSPHASGEFVAIQISSISADLYESELFGHERGAFTGANKSHDGVFARADSGTLFLDEIGALPPALQAKLLRAVGERMYRRVGGTRVLQLKCGVVAATQDDLESTGFREDLLARFGSVTIPPMSERREEILPLARHFLELAQQRDGKRGIVFSRDAESFLEQADYPDNARGLRRAIEQAVLKLSSNSVVQPGHLGTLSSGSQQSPMAETSGQSLLSNPMADGTAAYRPPGYETRNPNSKLDDLIPALSACAIPGNTEELRGLLSRLEHVTEQVRREIAMAALQSCRHPVSGKIRVLPAMQLITGNASMSPLQAKRKLSEILGRNQRDGVSAEELEAELNRRMDARQHRPVDIRAS